MKIDKKLIGKIVTHAKFGKGKIIDIEDADYLKVKFEDKESTFQKEAFFYGKLIFEDTKLQEQVDNEISEKEEEKKRNAQIKAEEEKRKIAEEAEKKEKQYRSNGTNGKNKENIVLRYQICDGGTANYSNWFKGPCTNALREYHINEDKHNTWCKRAVSICRKQIEGTLSDKDVQSAYDDGSLCYECNVLRNHEVGAGWDTDELGRPTKPRTWRLEDDRLVVLTTLEPKKEEKDRIIYSVFLSSNTTSGDDNKEAKTRAAGDYYIDLTIDEARLVKLWDYMPRPIDWRTGLFRYLDDNIAALILIDIVEIVKKRNDAKQTRNAEAFLKHYRALI